MADTMTVTEIESAIDAIETQGRYITLHGLPGACPSKQDCRAFESFMRSGYAAKEKLRRMATAIKQREQGAKDAALLKWAVSRWNAEVLHRPLVNVHRRTLDDTWRQVIRHAGGDDVVILGPRHDDLVAMAKESGNG